MSKMKSFNYIFIFLFTTFAFSQTNAEMNQKSGEKFNKFDKELNVIYQKIMKNTEEIQKERIKKAQVAWLKFRDLHCDCESKPYEGGSMESLIHTECLAKLTEERVNQLKTFL